MEDRLRGDDVFAFMQEITALARALLRHERHASLQATALVLTGLRRLGYGDHDWRDVTWENRRHFFGAARRAMKRALIDHATARRGRWSREIPVAPDHLQFYDLQQTMRTDPARVVALGEALAELAQTHPQWVEAIEYRFYLGLTLEETARMLGVNERQIRRWWDRALLVLSQRILQIMHEERLGAHTHASAH